MKIDRLQHSFAASIPEHIDPGILYISLDFATMMHLCACGCGREVVTPLSPKDWRMTYDGQTVSVHPSVGSWSRPCRSHYVIKHGNIRWAGDWTDEQIKKGRRADLMRKRGKTMDLPESTRAAPIAPEQEPARPGMLRRLWVSITGRG